MKKIYIIGIILLLCMGIITIILSEISIQKADRTIAEVDALITQEYGVSTDIIKQSNQEEKTYESITDYDFNDNNSYYTDINDEGVEISNEQNQSIDINNGDSYDSAGDSSDMWSDVDNINSDEVYVDVTSSDVYSLGLELYGISYLDTERTLKLITYEGYGYSQLSYYVACACWSRATENYWGYENLYAAFGGTDYNYNTWMDDLGIADYAYGYLIQCYENPTYIININGMAVPNDYIYAEYTGNYWIYVWN